MKRLLWALGFAACAVGSDAMAQDIGLEIGSKPAAAKVETLDGASQGAPTVIGVTAVAASSATAFFARGTKAPLIKNSIGTGRSLERQR